MVGLLLFLGNWAGPVWFSVAGLGSVVAMGEQGEAELDTPRMNTETAMGDEGKDSPTPTPNNTELAMDATTSASAHSTPLSSSTAWPAYLTHTTHLTLFLSSATLATMLACAALRTHLFVWTVFSPKFLYAVAWLVGWHVLFNLGVGGGLVAMG